jgi:hypothetical protein
LQCIGALPDTDASESCLADVVLCVLDQIAERIGSDKATAVVVVFKAEGTNVEARVVGADGRVDADEEVGPGLDGLVVALAAGFAGVCVVEARPDEVCVLVKVVGHDGVVDAERAGADVALGRGRLEEGLQRGGEDVDIGCVGVVLVVCERELANRMELADERATKVEAVQGDIAKGPGIGRVCAGAKDVPEGGGGLLSIRLAAEVEVGTGAAQTDHDLLAQHLAARDVGCQRRAEDASVVGSRLIRRLAGTHVEGGLSVVPIEVADEAHDDHVNVVDAAQVP